MNFAERKAELKKEIERVKGQKVKATLFKHDLKIGTFVDDVASGMNAKSMLEQLEKDEKMVSDAIDELQEDYNKGKADAGDLFGLLRQKLGLD